MYEFYNLVFSNNHSINIWHLLKLLNRLTFGRLVEEKHHLVHVDPFLNNFVQVNNINLPQNDREIIEKFWFTQN